jgi:hypothetical protein
MGLNRINNQIDLTTGTSGSIFRIGWSTPTGPGGLFEKNIHISPLYELYFFFLNWDNEIPFSLMILYDFSDTLKPSFAEAA